jgi:hypothetical protein
MVREFGRSLYIESLSSECENLSLVTTVNILPIPASTSTNVPQRSENPSKHLTGTCGHSVVWN